MLFIKFYAIINFVPGCGSAWLERRLREAEVASSNPATPIMKKVLDFQGLYFFTIETYYLATIGAYFNDLGDQPPLSKRQRGVI